MITVARQTLEFFVGSAVEDFVSSKLRRLRTPAAVAGIIDWVDDILWPGGQYLYAYPDLVATTATQAAPTPADNIGGGNGGNSSGNGGGGGGGGSVGDIRDGNRPEPEGSAAANVAIASAAAAVAAAADSSAGVDPDASAAEEEAGQKTQAEDAEEEEEAVRLKVRESLLAAGSRGPLPGLLGARNYTRAALDVLAAARSDLMTRQVGLLVMEAILKGLFPELDLQHSEPVEAPAEAAAEAGAGGADTPVPAAAPGASAYAWNL